MRRVAQVLRCLEVQVTAGRAGWASKREVKIVSRSSTGHGNTHLIYP